MLLFLLACSPGGRLSIQADEDLEPLLTDFVAYVGDERIALNEGRRGVRINVASLDDCSECFELTATRSGIDVAGGVPLGVQYGLAAAMEALGYRFYHPEHTLLPDELAVPDDVSTGRQEPQLSRRGLQLHTLHPIEALYAMHVPGEDDLQQANRIVDWTIKNRGNYLQWVSLANIESPASYEPWVEHTNAILEGGHARGLRFGLGVQLYGGANLQLAHDLIEDVGDEDKAEQVAEGLDLITRDTPFDAYTLSFGEFSDADPDTFIEDVNLAWNTLQDQVPGAEMGANIHVGADLSVTYNGEELLYYMLVKYADPGIVPWVHTVMYYDLFDDAGGAYGHDGFDEHRAYILDKLQAGEPVSYFPESAYWIAFDSPVPAFLPVYVKSRHTDLVNLPGLDDHVLFTSGWEWGYWLNDVATLRMNWQVPDDYGATLSDLLGPDLAAPVAELAEAQHTALIERRATPWFVGRDAIMDIGYGAGIVSQPERPAYRDVAGLSIEERESLRGVVEDLWALSEAADRTLPGGGPWLEELQDGFEMDRLRAAFVAHNMTALLDAAEGLDPVEELDAADALLEEARAVVDRRHAKLWDRDPERLITRGSNPTLYQYGYLLRAEELCFWERERYQTRAVVLAEAGTDPGCGL